MYKSLDEIPVTFGPAELASILGISRNKAYELTNRPGFPKYRLGKKIIISKKHFIEWMDEQFGDGDFLDTKNENDTDEASKQVGVKCWCQAIHSISQNRSENQKITRFRKETG